MFRYKADNCLIDKLYFRGFLVTDDETCLESGDIIPKWKKYTVQKYTFRVSEGQSIFICNKNSESGSLVLIGHAYNPFRSCCDEVLILNSLHESLCQKKVKHFWRTFNELTGIFTLFYINNNVLYIAGDASGIQTTFYSVYRGRVYIASHTNLIGDILGLNWDPYVYKLVHYRFFKLLGNSLPGDITQFKEVKRLVPNHYVVFRKEEQPIVKRFFTPSLQKLSDSEIVEQASDIMHANMALIAQKWKTPAISLTGGCDSKTTLACANGLYHRFKYFSYISSEAEKVDAEAAHQICQALGLEHRIYRIPDCDEELENVSDAADILFWNTGSIRRSNPNDVRKRIYFDGIKDFDIEVKSWASEIGRAYYSKRFHGRKDFGEKPTPRKCTTLYKFFFHNRKLVRQTDQIFKEYLEKYFRSDPVSPLPWQEQFFWEFRVPSWNGLVITGEHRYSFDITIPYNNRILLQLLLSTSIENRINDTIYAQIREKMNPVIERTGITVQNLLHTERRERAENLYYTLHSKFPL